MSSQLLFSAAEIFISSRGGNTGKRAKFHFSFSSFSLNCFFSSFSLSPFPGRVGEKVSTDFGARNACCISGVLLGHPKVMPIPFWPGQKQEQKKKKRHFSFFFPLSIIPCGEEESFVFYSDEKTMFEIRFGLAGIFLGFFSFDYPDCEFF